MTKLAIIGASYLQVPLIEKAKSRGIETHVFAWAANDIGETIADYFYPISIIEKDEILGKCKELKIDGICSIASDLAMITVNYVAEKMGLTSNSMECTYVSTNKHLMRRSFEANNDPSPFSIQVSSFTDLMNLELSYPLIVKPVDRSGSRGITKVKNENELNDAIQKALDSGFQKKALVEEYVNGDEYSVEYISWNGKHSFLAVTKKYTTGAPAFIETAHLEPSLLDDKTIRKIKQVVEHALTSLKITYGASHSEVKVTDSGQVVLIEIGGRMGGDFIGSSLVELSTGFDFLNGVIDVALGKEPVFKYHHHHKYAAVRFVFSKADVDAFEQMKKNDPGIIIDYDIKPISGREVTDSSTRFGYYLFAGDDFEVISQYLPERNT